jgi:hypothetical protein
MRLIKRPVNQTKKILKNDIKKFGWPVQLSSAACAAAFAGVLGFSSKISSISTLAPIANSDAARICLWALLGISAIAFAITWINELRLRKMLSFLTSDRGLANVLYWSLNRASDKEPMTEIVKSQIVDDIYQMGNGWRSWYRVKRLLWLRNLLRIRIPSDFADHAAESMLEELLERGVIFKKGMKGVYSLFGIDQLRAKEVLEERHEVSHPLFWR